MDQEKLIKAEPPVEPISSYRDESGYVPLTAWADDSPLRGESGGGWPQGHPLPLPEWDPGWGPSTGCPGEGRPGGGGRGSGRPAVRVATVEAYEELASQVEHTTQQLLRDHHYNTVGNFLRFHSAYEERAGLGDHDVGRLYREYQPPITDAHHTCVGLGLTLMRQLASLRVPVPSAGVAAGAAAAAAAAAEGSLRDALHLVSCEEAIENPAVYLNEEPSPQTSEKEHVLVAARLDIGGRRGILLLDPGYHVARVVTVMADGLYPHTGWFTQADEPDVRREYMYTLSPDEKYVLWSVRETRGERQSLSVNLVYIERAYLSAVDVTERRNLVYNFRTLLARNTKGQLTAGVYFPLAMLAPPAQSQAEGGGDVGPGPACTIFYTEVTAAGAGTRKRRVKIPFQSLLDPTQELDVEQDLALVRCSQQLGLHHDGLEELLTKVASVMADTAFMKQVLDINSSIEEMSEDN